MGIDSHSSLAFTVLSPFFQRRGRGRRDGAPTSQVKMTMPPQMDDEGDEYQYGRRALWCKLVGVGSCTPDTVVSNDDLAALGLDTSDEWIAERPEDRV